MHRIRLSNVVIVPLTLFCSLICTGFKVTPTTWWVVTSADSGVIKKFIDIYISYTAVILHSSSWYFQLPKSN